MAKNKWNGWKLQEMPVKDWNGLNWLELAQYGSEWLKSAKHGLSGQQVLEMAVNNFKRMEMA